jgi:small GTP-binding protein
MADDTVEVKVRRGGRARVGAGNLLSVSNLTRLPANIALIRKFMGLTNWKNFHEEIQGEMQRKVALVGLPNTGKSTLFNTLRGGRFSAVSAEAGTTTTLVRGAFGPFALIDTPGHLRDMQEDAVKESAMVVLLLDATRGLRKDDHALLNDLRKTGKPMVVALNKVDTLRSGTDPDDVAAEMAARLGVPDVIPIAARDGTNVGEELVPALIDASPDAALAIGLALPAFRRDAAEKVVRNATLVSLAAGMEPIPLLDIPILLGNQIRLVLRVAAIYGEPMTTQHVRELGATLVGGLALRYLGEQAAKLVPVGGDMVAGAIAAAGTWAMGQVAIEYFENGKRFSAKQLRERFTKYYERFREQRMDRQLVATAARPSARPALHATAPITPVQVVDAASDGASATPPAPAREIATGE